MSKAVLLQLVGWFSLPVLTVLLGVLIWRKIAKDFPYFFSYILFCVLVGFVRLWIYYARPHSYVSVFWFSEVLAAFTVFLATYELLVKRLFPRFHALTLPKHLFLAAGTLVIVFVVLEALQIHKLPVLAMTIQIFDVLRVTMLILLVSLMIFMGRRWNRYELGIAMGLVLEASASLAIAASWTQKFFMRHVFLLNQLPPLSYDISALIWLVTFLRAQEPDDIPTLSFRPELLKEARHMEVTLKNSLTSTGQ